MNPSLSTQDLKAALANTLPQRLALSILSASLVLSACGEVTKPAESALQTDATAISPEAALAKPAVSGIDTAHLAQDILPGDDFYRHVNKHWLDTSKIPVGMASFEPIAELNLSNEKLIAAIIKDAAAKNAPAGTAEQQIADLYASYMDVQGRNQRGFGMLKNSLEEILAAKDRSELVALMARPLYKSLFMLGTNIDTNNPQSYTVATIQYGLGLPSRDYYLNPKEPYLGHRSAYADYITGVFQRAGLANAKARAKAIVAFETKLAKVQWSPEQGRDPVKNNHVMSKAELLAYAPGFDWDTFLNASGYEDVKSITVSTDTAVKKMAAEYKKTALDTLRDYVAFHYLNNHAELLSEDWSDAYFDFFSRRLTGIDQQRPLDERAVAFVSSALGEVVSKLYVERHFPADYKAKILEMVGFIKESMHEHIEKLDWMDDATRSQALTKLANFKTNIAYPDRWHDYSSVHIQKDDLVSNMVQLVKWYRADDLTKLKEPVRDWEWGNNPHEVNAYYASDRNQIVFLAGILQAPYFDPNADPAVNFGAIGMVIGHEIGHGFDDQGSHYDGTGKLRNWWSPASAQKFKVKTDRLAKQYSTYEPLKGVHIKGELTLGENIGDMCGISVAYSAYQKFAAAKYANGTAPVIDGLTGNQRFFMGYAQIWRTLWKDEALRYWLLTNAHSPGEYRVNGVMTNFTPWYETFGVTENNKMYLPPQDRISIW